MHFGSERHVKAQEVVTKLKTVLIGIILKAQPELHEVKMIS